MLSASPLKPTFYGHVASTQDALLLFEACLSGSLNHVARRPHDHERVNLIKSGNVFIYEEHSSGIKRWTDHVSWSPSRILGDFLVYRELERPFAPGEMKRAIKHSRRSLGISKQKPYSGANSAMSNRYNTAHEVPLTMDSLGSSSMSKETERWLIGSLVDSYGFKDEGLVKKTMSVTVEGISHHLVSYYTVADIASNNLATPSKIHRFQHIIPRPDLVTKQNYRMLINQIELLDPIDNCSTYAFPPYARNGYETTNQIISHHQMPLLAPPMVDGEPSRVYQGCGISPPSGSYDATPPLGHLNNSFENHSAPSNGIYPVVKGEDYNVSGFQYQQRYNSVFGTGSDPNRTATSPMWHHFSRQGHNFESNNEINLVLFTLSSSSVDTTLNHDSVYVSSQAYYNNLREGNHNSQHHDSQRSLPAPGQQTGYDRAPVRPSYILASNLETKNDIWQMGNTSSGHDQL